MDLNSVYSLVFGSDGLLTNDISLLYVHPTTCHFSLPFHDVHRQTHFDIYQQCNTSTW